VEHVVLGSIFGYDEREDQIHQRHPSSQSNQQAEPCTVIDDGNPKVGLASGYRVERLTKGQVSDYVERELAESFGDVDASSVGPTQFSDLLDEEVHVLVNHRLLITQRLCAESMRKALPLLAVVHGISGTEDGGRAAIIIGVPSGFEERLLPLGAVAVNVLVGLD
jgi:hypothetical protein